MKLPTLTAVAKLIQNTEMGAYNCKGEWQSIKTKTGLVQGSCLSPTLFNIYVADLMRKLN